MLFNSFEFIFVFLPVIFILYFFLNKLNFVNASKVTMIIGSLVFYSWWNISYLPLIVASLLINFTLGRMLLKQSKQKKIILILGLIFNVGLLGYYKYADFFINNVNNLLSTHISLLQLALPLAISFFTFQQIAYLVDAFRGETRHYSFLDYSLFVCFFPQLIAGPIVHHEEMMPQFKSLKTKVINYRNISLGIFIFAIGLFKKVVIADTFAVWATHGFDNTEILTFIEAWIVSLSYTIQLYFDFSGYTDMAIGIALIFNIILPNNFNSPYKAISIQDFWKRWHITLSRFLTKYIYIPLGGNRKGAKRTYINIMLVFLISGIWHGAGWTFIFWGFLHGFASVINRFWQSFNIKLNPLISWFLTFNFINITWVFFRATSWADAEKVLKGMFGLSGFRLPTPIADKINFLSTYSSEFFISDFNEFVKIILLLGLILILAFFFKNSGQLLHKFKPSFISAIFIIVILSYTVLNLNNISEFLYFNF